MDELCDKPTRVASFAAEIKRSFAVAKRRPDQEPRGVRTVTTHRNASGSATATRLAGRWRWRSGRGAGDGAGLARALATALARPNSRLVHGWRPRLQKKIRPACHAPLRSRRRRNISLKHLIRVRCKRPEHQAQFVPTWHRTSLFTGQHLRRRRMIVLVALQHAFALLCDMGSLGRAICEGEVT